MKDRITDIEKRVKRLENKKLKKKIKKSKSKSKLHPPTRNYY